MVLVRKARTFYLLPSRVKWLLPKAVLLSAIVKIVLVFLPFRIVLKWLGKIKVESPSHADPPSLELRREIKRVVGLCDRYTFWKTECYTQALVAKILLENYGMSSTVYIGFYKDEKGSYKGHAWLRCYDTIITGGYQHKKFNVQSFFS